MNKKLTDVEKFNFKRHIITKKAKELAEFYGIDFVENSNKPHVMIDENGVESPLDFSKIFPKSFVEATENFKPIYYES